eukprot:TRINITY_DN652_c0_g1_i1.p1 TRINITY_DN652_c0_g1~~TRINITY_DN652_c0_g1_i1.p1  ORF type:complete len:93 (+),score=35.87 TRINITY_DN652_c0_g1_i1:32-310(+)
MAQTPSPFSQVADMKFGEFLGTVSKNLNWGGIKSFAHNSLEWYADTYGRKAKAGSGRPVIHVVAACGIIGYLIQRPKLREHGEHGGYKSKYH